MLISRSLDDRTSLVTFYLDYKTSFLNHSRLRPDIFGIYNNILIFFNKNRWFGDPEKQDWNQVIALDLGLNNLCTCINTLSDLNFPSTRKSLKASSGRTKNKIVICQSQKNKQVTQSFTKRYLYYQINLRFI